MQVVIDIPEKWFDDMVREEFTEVDELCAVIQHSTLLPKGHGRLIDEDVAFDELRAYVGFSNLCDALNSVPTIIDADNAESEDKE